MTRKAGFSVSDRDFTVRAMHCDHLATEEEVYQVLVRATAPLTNTWERLARAKRIGIKINQDKHPDGHVTHAGMLQQLVCDKVVRATLRLLRERTTAEIICTDVSFYAMYNGTDAIETAAALPAMDGIQLTQHLSVRRADAHHRNAPDHAHRR